MSSPIKKGVLYDVSIHKLAFGGQGVARINDFVVFIKRAVPGQKVKIRVTKINKKYAEAKLIEVLSKSPDEVDPICSHFGVCGGCVWQNLDYEKQLKYKQQQVDETIKHVGKIHKFEMLPIIKSPQIWDYRNKIELSFGYEKMWYEKKDDGGVIYHDENPSIGFHRIGRWEEIIPIDTCFLMTAKSSKLIPIFKKLIRNSKYNVYNQKTHQGYFRQIVIREGKNTDELLVNFVVNGLENKPQRNKHNTHRKEPTISEREETVFKTELDCVYTELKQVEGIKGIIMTKNDGVADAVNNPCTRIIWGRDYIYEKIGDLRFKISPYSFFQTNTLGAEKLYDTVKKMACLNGRQRVIDLYCGTGGISQYISDKCDHVYGFDISEHAIEDARKNARKNNLLNTEFITAAIEDELNTMRSIVKDCNVNVIIVDPPRAGMHNKVLKELAKLGVPRIIYVSCNPSTLARDMSFLCKQAGYSVGRVQPVDMFPHTAHIETVAELKLQ